jgi:Pyruvate/2-oxoacid:ferredoxin oxidoreductase delta subunit
MSAISRRDLFRSLFGRRPEIKKPLEELPISPKSSEEPAQLALILDRFCLAYQGSFCSICSERCPADGAITVEQGKPRVNPDFCTGCKICHDVCPAPKKAIFLVSRKPRQGMVAHLTSEPPLSAELTKSE